MTRVLTRALDHLPHPRRELARLVLGGLLVLLVQAYGAAAVAAVLLSDAETPGDKARSAVAAVPTLVEEYDRARYLVENRDEIRDAVDYLEREAPPREEVERTLDESGETLRSVEATFEALDEAQDDFTSLRPYEALGPAQDAWESRPSLDALRDLGDTAERLGPVADRVEVLLPAYYGGVATVNDNLASDELAATLGVAVAALVVAAVLAHAVGFWVRRGRPGLLARALQRLGARVFRRWYVDHAPYALGGPVFDTARQRVERDLLAGAAAALSPAARAELEGYLRREAADAR